MKMVLKIFFIFIVTAGSYAYEQQLPGSEMNITAAMEGSKKLPASKGELRSFDKLCMVVATAVDDAGCVGNDKSSVKHFEQTFETSHPLTGSLDVERNIACRYAVLENKHERVIQKGETIVAFLQHEKSEGEYRLLKALPHGRIHGQMLPYESRLEVVGVIEDIVVLDSAPEKKTRNLASFQVKVKILGRCIGDWKEPYIYFTVHSPARDLAGVEYKKKGAYQGRVLLFLFERELNGEMKFKKVITPFGMKGEVCKQCKKGLQWFSMNFSREERQWGYCPQHGEQNEIGMHFSE